ncbi:MAG: carbon monoxide dehydrogenase subunit G [Anaerolineae bacterium]
MKVAGEYVFNGPREQVWELVRDPEVLATALPGTQSLNQVSENEYEGEMHVRVGPVAGVFSGRVVASDEVPPESYTLTVEGKGAPGFAKGTGHVQLVDQGDGTTLMKYEGEVQIGGKIASVGQRLLDTASKSMIRQGLETLNKALEMRVAKSEGQEQVEYKPPSETEFAAAVAKDMAGEVLSPSRMIWIAVAVVIVVVIVAVVWFSTRGV